MSKLFNTIEELFGADSDCSKDFYEIYEENGEKHIRFSGYVYTNGEAGYRFGKRDESLVYRIVTYDGMAFTLAEYLTNPEKMYNDAYEVRGCDYIKDASEEEALEEANNWFGSAEVQKNYDITNIYPVDCFFCFFLKSFAGLKKK